MYAAEHPGCIGAAARLPKKPGSQKLTPPSSAIASFIALKLAMMHAPNSPAALQTNRFFASLYNAWVKGADLRVRKTLHARRQRLARRNATNLGGSPSAGGTFPRILRCIFS